MSEISELASEIIESEFDYLTGTDRNCQLSSTESWLKYNLGKLNNRIYTCYSGEDPGLKLEERAIYKNMYLSNYYAQESRKVLRNMSSDTLEWITLKEGDSVITRHNKNEVAKTLRGLSSEFANETENLITSYIKYQSNPMDVGVVTVKVDGACG